jgi:hypothetical protein
MWNPETIHSGKNILHKRTTKVIAANIQQNFLIVMAKTLPGTPLHTH